MFKKLAGFMLITLAIGWSGPAGALAQAGKCLPKDEAAKDPSFFRFRARLMEAVGRRDAAWLLSVISPKIELSFGGAQGTEDFVRMWKPDDPRSELWPTMMAVLALGGLFEGPDRFAAPFTFRGFPDEVDVFQYSVIIGTDVRVRRAPGRDAPVMATLSWDIVKVVEQASGREPIDGRRWAKVELADKRQGYVAEEDIRSPIDFRAVFERSQGRWLMTVFIAGD